MVTELLLPIFRFLSVFLQSAVISKFNNFVSANDQKCLISDLVVIILELQTLADVAGSRLEVDLFLRSINDSETFRKHQRAGFGAEQIFAVIDETLDELRVGFDTFGGVAAEQECEISRVGLRGFYVSAGFFFISFSVFVCSLKYFCPFDITLSAASKQSQEVAPGHVLCHVSDFKLYVKHLVEKCLFIEFVQQAGLATHRDNSMAGKGLN